MFSDDIIHIGHGKQIYFFKVGWGTSGVPLKYFELYTHVCKNNWFFFLHFNSVEWKTVYEKSRALLHADCHVSTVSHPNAMQGMPFGLFIY